MQFQYSNYTYIHILKGSKFCHARSNIFPKFNGSYPRFQKSYPDLNFANKY